MRAVSHRQLFAAFSADMMGIRGFSMMESTFRGQFAPGYWNDFHSTFPTLVFSRKAGAMNSWKQGQWVAIICVFAGASLAGGAARAGDSSTAKASTLPPGAIDMAAAGGLQAALDALPASGGTIFVPPGRHVLTETAVKHLAERQHLTLVGAGRASILVNENREGQDLLQLVGVKGVISRVWPDLKITIRDLSFLGNHQSGDALVIQYPYDTLVEDCFFEGHGGRAVYFKTNGSNVTCRDCWMRDCKRGVYCESLHHLTLSGLMTRSLPGGQEQAEQLYLGSDCREIRVVGNHFAYGHNEAIIIHGSTHHVISGNTIEGFRVGILGKPDPNSTYSDCRDVTIGTNYINGGCAVKLDGKCDGFAISNNIIIAAGDGAVVIRNAEGSGAHCITGNIIRKSAFKQQGGIHLGDSVGCTVVGNVFQEVLASPAISAGPGGGKHVIASNNITKAPGEQIVVKDAADCLVSGNLVDGAMQ